MRAWPKEITEDYPISEDVHWPERPWWGKKGVDGLGWPNRLGSPFVSRIDGKYVLDLSPVEAARFDRLHPLPHPGFRVGQVWGNEFGDAVIVQRVEDGHPMVLRSSPIHGHDVLIDMSCARFCFLIADPCCPRFAPWSPATADSDDSDKGKP